MPEEVTLVQGTWGGKFVDPAGPFCAMLASKGLTLSLPPFVWSGDVSGVPNFTSNQKHSDWLAGGASFAYRVALIRSLRPLARILVITHSYGGCIPAYACAEFGVTIDRLVTVSCPPRADMEPVWTKARPRIGYWLNMCDRKAPMIERVAQWFDGHVDWKPKIGQHQADRNQLFDDVGHSGLFEGKHYEKWGDAIVALLEPLAPVHP